MYVRTWVCMYVCMYVCIYVYVFILFFSTSLIKKTQLQEKLDSIRPCSARCKSFNKSSMKARRHGSRPRRRQGPKPDELDPSMDVDPLPAALETFVTNLGVSLSDEQKSQLRGLLKRPSSGSDDLTKRQKTDFFSLQEKSPWSLSRHMPWVELQGFLTITLTSAVVCVARTCHRRGRGA